MRVAVFKAGVHTDSAGRTREWTAADLDAIARKYNESAHDAPVVIGHPRDNAPAYGWVGKSMNREGDILYAEVRPTDAAFTDWLKAGLYKKRSISLYPDMTLRHVGFLGAQPPAVKGLPDFAFSEAEAALYEFGDEALALNVVGQIFGRFRDWVIGKFGQDTADGIVNSGEVDYLKQVKPDAGEAPAFAEVSPEKRAQEARSKKYGIGVKPGGNVTKPADYANIADDDFADPVNYRYPLDADYVKGALSYWGKKKNEAEYTAQERSLITARIVAAAKKAGIEVDPEKWKFTEGGDMDRIQELEAKLREAEVRLASFAEKDRELEALRAQIAAEKTSQRKAEFAAFCEDLVGRGRLTPAQKPVVVDLMEALHGVGEYEFAEGGRKPAVDALRVFLEGMPVQVEFGERATKGQAGEGRDFSNATELSRAALEYQESERKAGRVISISDAVNHIKEQGGER